MFYGNLKKLDYIDIVDMCYLVFKRILCSVKLKFGWFDVNGLVEYLGVCCGFK